MSPLQKVVWFDMARPWRSGREQALPDQVVLHSESGRPSRWRVMPGHPRIPLHMRCDEKRFIGAAELGNAAKTFSRGLLLVEASWQRCPLDWRKPQEGT